MACSTYESASVTCYVPHGNHLLPVYVPSNTRLTDLVGALHDANSHVKLRETKGKNSDSRSVILVIGQEGSEAESEDVATLIDQAFTGSSSIANRNPTEGGATFAVSTPRSSNGGDDDPLVPPRMSLKGSSLYTYMWLTFQWIEPREEGNYSGKFAFMLYKIMRAAVALSLWAAMGFEIFNVFNGLSALLASTNTFTSIVAVMHRLLWTLRYVILHHLGLWFFEAHRGHINDILTNKGRVSFIQWQRSRRLINDHMAATAFVLLALPLLQKLIPIFIEHASGIPRNWDVTVESVEFFVLVYSRVMAMPAFFFLVLVVEIHILELKNFNEQIQQSDKSLTELLRKFKTLSRRIQNSSLAFQPLIVALLFLLVLWGTISVYSSVEMFEHIPSSRSIYYGVVLSECLGTFGVFLCETVFLFSLPLYKLGQVSSQLSHLIYTVTTIDCDDQRERGFVFKTEEKKVLFSGLLERHQRYGNVGFKVAGLQLTQLKSIWLTLLGPVIVFVGNIFLKEHF